VAVNYATLAIKEAGSIHTITMNRPERRNALNPQMIAELIHALGESAACPCGVVVLTGAGTAFCSGLDLENLKSLRDQRPEDQRADAESTMWMMRRLYELSKPTIAAVNGAAIAGGTGLATLCDFTIAAPQAKFGYTEVKIGFIPAIVSVFLLEMLGENPRRPGSPVPGTGDRGGARGRADGARAGTGGPVAQEQPGIDECSQEATERFCQRTA
jgi:methylglutaconyl-CoA hydratase